MRVDAVKIRSGRRERAWSQERLAELAGLGLRTIQRIESSGVAAMESVSALAAVLEIPLSELILSEPPATLPAEPVQLPKTGDSRLGLAEWLDAKRRWLLVSLALPVLVLGPQDAAVRYGLVLSLWTVLELTLLGLNHFEALRRPALLSRLRGAVSKQHFSTISTPV